MGRFLGAVLLGIFASSCARPAHRDDGDGRSEGEASGAPSEQARPDPSADPVWGALLKGLRPGARIEHVTSRLNGQRLDFDEDARLDAGRAVLVPEGLVGAVRLRDDQADVLFITSPASGVEARNPRSSGRCFVRGTGEEQLDVAFAARSDDYRVGDVLETSGVGMRFPKGIPVCRVTSVETGDSGVYRRITCEPVAKLKDIALVVVAGAP